MTQHLEPCPFCGSAAGPSIENDEWIACTNSRCDAMQSGAFPRNDAVAAWNTRTPPKTQAPDAGATQVTSTLLLQGDLGDSGGLIERLRKTKTILARQHSRTLTGSYEPVVVTVPLNPDGPEAAAEIERLQRELKRMYLAWDAADHEAGENWAKLKLVREGLGAIDMARQPYHEVNRRIRQTLKALGGDE